MDGARCIDGDRATRQQVEIGSGRHARRDGRIETGRAVVDRDEPLSAPREGNRVGAVVPPMVYVGARDDMAEAHHLQDRGVVMLADPLACAGGLEARSTCDGGGPTIRVRRWTQRVL